MPSIIIPAHNEASVIIRCLKTILHGAYPNELEIIVVCNGCTDNTAELASSVDGNINIIITDVPSKSNALNLGDSAATRYPRFYVDADVVVPLYSIRKTTSALEKCNILAAAPKMNADCNERNFLVRSFYKVWLQLPYFREGMIGSGVYALNKNGRKRFRKFPSITADDGFIYSLFSKKERLTLHSCSFTIFPPKTLRDIVNIKTRAYFGKVELQKSFPNLIDYEEVSPTKDLLKLSLRPCWWFPLSVYFYVRFISRLKALYRFRHGVNDKWERDETSRETA